MSVTIPQNIIEFIEGKPGWVATADKNGLPNVAPKGSLKVLDEHTLFFADLFSRKTRSNLEQNPQVAVMVVDMEKHTGYILKGEAENISEGALYESVSEELKKKMPGLLAPRYVVKITVNAIYDQSVGPEAGKQIV